MKVLSPNRMLFIVLTMLASMARTTDAQLIANLIDFLGTFDSEAFFENVCPTLAPVFEYFEINPSVCDEGDDDEPAPAPAAPAAPAAPTAPTAPAPVAAPVTAPNKKGKAVAGTAAPVAPSAAP